MADTNTVPYGADLPPEMQAQLAAILSRRKLAETNAARYSGGFLASSALRDLDANDKQLSELAGKYQTGLQGAMQDYVRTRSGSPGVPDPSMETGGVPAAKPDPQKAVFDALMNRFGPMQRLGNAEFTHQLKQQDPYTLNAGDQRVIPQPDGTNRTVLNPKVAEHQIPDNWETFLPPGAKRLPTDPQGVFRLPGTDNQQDVYAVEFELGKPKGYKKLDSSQIIRDPSQSAATTTIQDPLDPTKTLVVRSGVFNEAKYKAGDRTGVIGAGPKPSTEGVGRAEGFATFQNVNSNLDKLEKQVKLTLDSNLGRTTGLPGMLPNIPGFAGADAAGRLEGLKSQIGFEALQALRNAAHNGASGLGQVTEKEHIYLQTQLGNLAKAQSEKEIRRVLGDIQEWIAGARTRYQQAYDARFKAGGGGSALDAALDQYK